jgi:hypothetical protein
MRTTRSFAVTLAVAIAALAVPAAHAQRPDPAQADLHASVALAAAPAQRPDPAQADMHASVALASGAHGKAPFGGSESNAPASSTDGGGSANGLGALAGVIVIGLAYLYLSTRRRRLRVSH